MADTTIDFYVRTRPDAVTLTDRLILAGCDVDRHPGQSGQPYPFHVIATVYGGKQLSPDVTNGLDVRVGDDPNQVTF